MATNYGVDVGTFFTNEDGEPDITPTFRLISQRRVVVESVLRLWSTQRGTLITDESAGDDLADWLNAGLDTSGLRALESVLESAATRDERVSTCTVDASFAADAENTVRLVATIRLADTDETEEPFTFVANASSVTLELLERS